MIDLLQDLDNLLQTGPKFLLGKWISDAKSWGVTEGVMILLTFHRCNFSKTICKGF